MGISISQLLNKVNYAIHLAKQALDGGGGSAGVSSFKGRTGVVVPQVDDYSAAQITESSTKRFVTDGDKASWNAKQAAIGYTPENVLNKGQSNGYAPLNSSGKIDSTFLPASGGSGGDLLATLLNTEIPITGATTLDTSAFGKMHVCSGTAFDYAVTLPSVTGNAGKLIGFRMAPSLTMMTWLDGAGNEAIDGELMRGMWKNETAILLCTGSAWVKVAGKSIPMQARLQLQHTSQAGQAQSIPPQVMTKILHNEGSASLPTMFNTSSSTITVARRGYYQVFATTAYSGDTSFSASRLLARLAVNGAEVLGTEASAATGSYPTFSLLAFYTINAGDVLDQRTYQNSGDQQYLYGQRLNYLQIIEVPNW